jgi:hypothetical protein
MRLMATNSVFIGLVEVIGSGKEDRPSFQHGALAIVFGKCKSSGVNCADFHRAIVSISHNRTLPEVLQTIPCARCFSHVLRPKF